MSFKSPSIGDEIPTKDSLFCNSYACLFMHDSGITLEENGSLEQLMVTLKTLEEVVSRQLYHRTK